MFRKLIEHIRERREVRRKLAALSSNHHLFG